MVSSLLGILTLFHAMQISSAASSLSYHPDYSKLSLSIMIIILGALICLAILIIAFIILCLTRPKLLTKIDREMPSSRISLHQKKTKRLLRRSPKITTKDYELNKIEMSATSTVSKTGEESNFKQLTDTKNNDSKLPPLLEHTDGKEPITFYFKETNPKIAILPVLVMMENEKRSHNTPTVLESSEKTSKNETLATLPVQSTQTGTIEASSSHNEPSTAKYPSDNYLPNFVVSDEESSKKSSDEESGKVESEKKQ